MPGLSGLSNHLRERSLDGSFLMRLAAMISILLGTPGSVGPGLWNYGKRGVDFTRLGRQIRRREPPSAPRTPKKVPTDQDLLPVTRRIAGRRRAIEFRCFGVRAFQTC